MLKPKEGSVLPDVALYAALIVVAYELFVALSGYADIVDKALHFTFPITYGEGPVLDQVLRLARAEHIYHTDIITPPYTLTSSTPLFQLLQVPFIQTGALRFWYGRVIAIVCAVIAAILIAGIVYSLTKDWIASALGGAVLFCFPHIVFGSVINQPDTLALALSLSAMVLLVRWPTKLPAIALAALLCAAAIYTSPRYFIGVPLGGFLWLWRSQARRQAVIWLGLVVAICTTAFVILNAYTAGGFSLHVVLFNTLEWHPINFVDYMLNTSLRAGYLLIGCALILVVERLGEPQPIWRLASSYGLAAFCSAFTVMRADGSLNDLYEVVAACALIAGGAVAWLGKNNRWLKAAAIVALAVQIGSLNTWVNEQYLPLFKNKVENVRDTVQLAKIVRDANGHVLADEFMGLLPLDNQPLQFQPAEFKRLGEAGLWDEAPLIARIERQEFKAILLYESSAARTISVRWSPAIRKAIYAHYQQQALLADTLVYVPKNK